MNTIRVLLIIGVAVAVAPQQASHPPRFEEYPARAPFSGKPAPVNLASNRNARRYRTVLRQGAAQGPNFAGRYTIVKWGCGSPCKAFAIIDAKTGGVWIPHIWMGL